MSGGGGTGLRLRAPGPGTPPSPGRPGGPLGRTESRLGRLRRAGDDAPRAGGEAAAALSRSGEPRSARAPAGPRREFGERRGSASLAAVCPRSHPRTRVSPRVPLPLGFQLCARGPERTWGWPGRRREGAGLRGWRGSRRPRAPPGGIPAPRREMG